MEGGGGVGGRDGEGGRDEKGEEERDEKGEGGRDKLKETRVGEREGGREGGRAVQNTRHSAVSLEGGNKRLQDSSFSSPHLHSHTPHPGKECNSSFTSAEGSKGRDQDSLPPLPPPSFSGLCG